MHPLHLCLSTLVLSLGGAAQQLPGIVFTAPEGQRCRVMPPNCRGVAITPENRVLVCVLSWSGSPSPTRNEGGTLWLCRSDDGGKTFGRPLQVAKGVSGRASILARRDSEVCDLVWDARRESGGVEPWHQTYDAAQGSLRGEARCLLRSPQSRQDSYVTDICPLPDGSLAVTLFANRSPVKPMVSAWDGALLLLDAERSPGKALRLNVGSTGIQASLQPDGEGLLRIGFRSHGTQGYGLYERRFSLQTGTFAAARPRILVPSGRLDQVQAEPSNTGVMARDGQGGFYLLYGWGQPSHKSRQPKGGLRISYRPRAGAADKPAWQAVQVAEDEGPDGGNVNPLHFGLSRGPGNQVFAIYTLRREGFARIYRAAFAEGRAFGKPQLLKGGAKGSFRAINTLRDHRLYSTLWAVGSGEDPRSGRERVQVLAGTLPLRSFWDREPR